MGVDDSDAGLVMLSESLFFNSEAGKELRLTSPLASRLEAALIGPGVGVFLTRRHGDTEALMSRVPRERARFAPQILKCAGEGKPDFIKCGFGEAEEMAVELKVA